MKLLVLMYHRARAGRHGNAPEMLDEHLGHIAAAYHNVLPGDALAPHKLNVCLTFDDAYYDFHAIVFPLLKKHGLRAVLAVPPFYISENSSAPDATRLGLESDEAFANPARGGFCTWRELEEMTSSGHVAIAAHGYSHCRLDAEVNLPIEIDNPQSILSKRLRRPVDSFVFPYGRFSPRALRQAKNRYAHVFRIGGALNRGWGERVLYRVDADQMETSRDLFSARRLRSYRARYLWNKLRMR